MLLFRRIHLKISGVLSANFVSLQWPSWGSPHEEQGCEAKTRGTFGAKTQGFDPAICKRGRGSKINVNNPSLCLNKTCLVRAMFGLICTFFLMNLTQLELKKPQERIRGKKKIIFLSFSFVFFKPLEWTESQFLIKVRYPFCGDKFIFDAKLKHWML